MTSEVIDPGFTFRHSFESGARVMRVTGKMTGKPSGE